MEERIGRYAREHKHETRQRIIATAGRRLKRDGIDGSGVATLMKDAGLTNGAFYAHFTSKDSLVAIAIADQLHRLHANIVAQAQAQAQPGPACLADGPAMTSRPADLDRRPRPAADLAGPRPRRRRAAAVPLAGALL
jgi:AcrR family transcriptional regulator